jgi:hypothetical protein
MGLRMLLDGRVSLERSLGVKRGLDAISLWISSVNVETRAICNMQCIIII